MYLECKVSGLITGSGSKGFSKNTCCQLTDFQYYKEAVSRWFKLLLKTLVCKFTYLASTGACSTPNSGDSFSDIVVLEEDKCHSEDGQISVKTTSSSLTLEGKVCFSPPCWYWFCAVFFFFKRSGLKDCKRINSEIHIDVRTIWIVNYPFVAGIPFAFLPSTGIDGEMGNSYAI